MTREEAITFLSDLKNGFICPVCHKPTTTFRHMHAKKWCDNCGYILSKEGDTKPYNYKKHISKDTIDTLHKLSL